MVKNKKSKSKTFKKSSSSNNQIDDPWEVFTNEDKHNQFLIENMPSKHSINKNRGYNITTNYEKFGPSNKFGGKRQTYKKKQKGSGPRLSTLSNLTLPKANKVVESKKKPIARPVTVYDSYYMSPVAEADAVLVSHLPFATPVSSKKNKKVKNKKGGKAKRTMKNRK